MDKQLAQSIVQARIDGTITQTDAEAILGFVSEWKTKATEETKAAGGGILGGVDQLPGLIKIAILGALGLGLVNVVLSIRKAAD